MEYLTKYSESMILMAMSIYFLLLWLRKIPIKKDPERDEIAYEKLSKTILAFSLISLLIAIICLF